MKQRLVWGPWETSSFIHCGLEYIQKDVMSIEITCSTATRRIQPIPAYTGRGQQLSPYQQTQCREVLGALQWCATQILFRICCDVSVLQNRISKGESDVLTDVSKCLRFAQETCHIPLQYMPITSQVAVCIWADGSWANRTCGQFKGAYLTFYVDAEFLTGTFGHVNIAMFSNKKLPRVAKSSTAMEVQCVVVGHEETEHVRAAMDIAPLPW